MVSGLTRLGSTILQPDLALRQPRAGARKIRARGALEPLLREWPAVAQQAQADLPVQRRCSARAPRRPPPVERRRYRYRWRQQRWQRSNGKNGCQQLHANLSTPSRCRGSSAAPSGCACRSRGRARSAPPARRRRSSARRCRPRPCRRPGMMIDLHLRHLRDAHRLVGVEVLLHDAPVLDRALLHEQRRQAVDERARDLALDLRRVDRVARIGGRDDAVHLDLVAVLRPRSRTPRRRSC